MSVAPAATWPWLLMVLVAGLAGQALLWSNPGYFSHDELQWGHAAWQERMAELPWFGWTRIDVFQYRPLTFNLWLLASFHLFDTPRLFHGLWVALGTVNGLLLFTVLRRWGIRNRPAALGATAFLLSPVAAHVHGWVGTLGDLLWLGSLLAIALLGLRVPGGTRRSLARAGCAALLCSAALLAKESAIVIAPLCAVAWLLSLDKRSWLPVALACSIPTVAYLALRLGVIDAAAEGTSYAWSPASVPVRWLEYQLYPFLPTTFEPLATLQASTGRLCAAGLLCLLAYGLAFAAHRRLGLGLLLGSAAALGPVLLLGTSYAQYGYGSIAVLAGVLAAAGQRLATGRAATVVLCVLALVSTWHGVNVQRQIHRVGELQAVFTPALTRLAAVDTGEPLRLRAPAAQRWIFERFTREVPGYRGVDYLRQPVIVGEHDAASHEIAPSGTITPLAP